MKPKKLKRVPLKEELVALTGDFVKALILQQFLYWSERVADFDAFILEEKERSPDLDIEFRHGWIYKSAEELHDELMFGDNLSPRTVKRRLDEIVSAGYLVSRNNPKHKWDRCLQYRPDIQKIQTDLKGMGYALEGYPLLIQASPFDAVSNASVTASNRTVTDDQAIPETTTETTTESLKASSADADFLYPISYLSEKEIKASKFPLSDWQQHLSDERVERKRKGVIKFLENKVAKGALLPDTPESHLLFEKIAVECQAAGHRPPTTFPTLATKNKFDEAAAKFNGTLDAVLDKAIHARGKGIAKITDYISSPKWQQENTTNEQTRARTGQRQTSSNQSGGQKTSANFAPPPGSGQTPEMAAKLRAAFAPKPG